MASKGADVEQGTKQAPVMTTHNIGIKKLEAEALMEQAQVVKKHAKPQDSCKGN